MENSSKIQIIVKRIHKMDRDDAKIIRSETNKYSRWIKEAHDIENTGGNNIIKVDLMMCNFILSSINTVSKRKQINGA